MTKHISVREARANFSDVTNAVFYTKEPVIVEKKGRPVVVMISPEQYDSFRDALMERFREARDELQRLNADKDPGEVLRDVTEIVEEVRREQYEREQRAQASRSH